VEIYAEAFSHRITERCLREIEKAKYAVPIGGEFVVDVDSFMRKRWHHHCWHPQYAVCEGCLDISKHLTLELCDRIASNHRDVQIVFSGRRGFHIHVLDFNYRDWAFPNPHNPVKAMAAARYKYASKVLPGTVWDTSHFIVSVARARFQPVMVTLSPRRAMKSAARKNRWTGPMSG
jgi:hypothetical protein